VRITDVKLFYVNPGTRTSFGTGWNANYLLLRITTDEGIHGVGEAFHTGKDKATEGALLEYARWLVGRDPIRILHHWYAIFRGARYPLGAAESAALSAVEHALWDINGKALGAPVHRLLGGTFRDRVRLYASTYAVMPDNYDQREPKALAAACLVARERGFDAVKITPQPPRWHDLSTSALITACVARVSAVREAVGDTVDVALDFHGRELSPTVAIMLARELEPLRPLFLEEPALSEHPDSLAEVKAKTTIPIAAGERCIGRERVRELLARGAVHILQPEPAVNGGILETVKWAAFAELHHVLLAPHHACSPVSLMVNAHIDTVAPNFLIQECHVDLDTPFVREVFRDLPEVVAGHLLVRDAPGLGIDFDEDAAARYPYRPYDRPVIVKADGSIGLE
jgi:galactonate dehydratase